MTAPAVRQYYNRLLFSLGIKTKEKEDMTFQSTGLENSSRLKLRLAE